MDLIKLEIRDKLFEVLSERVESEFDALNEKGDYPPYTFNFFKDRVKDNSMGKFYHEYGKREDKRDDQLVEEIFYNYYDLYVKIISELIKEHGEQALEKFIKAVKKGIFDKDVITYNDLDHETLSIAFRCYMKIEKYRKSHKELSDLLDKALTTLLSIGR